MPPSRSLPPLEFCFGTRPIQAARSRPVLNTAGSATLATNALASSGPTPGMAISRRPTGALPDAPVVLQHLLLHHGELGCQHRQAHPCVDGDAPVLVVVDDGQQ